MGVTHFDGMELAAVPEHCLSNTVMDWLRGRMFFGGGSSNASSADDEERRLVEQPSTSSTRVLVFVY
ncbi:hypothetical protein NECAME_02962 [Necator americanus]|uniref:Uncharacterized protein n=1 Tax=Necator americanus TaxID=51031 RepID=W2TAR3_NECAM|nr:hypothetical protein NECAME_02962 [Necator americanus]ETN78256.1 hypothetical protein NECAME_02962 [Necator americanus]